MTENGWGYDTYRDWGLYNDLLVRRGVMIFDLDWMRTYEDDLAAANSGKRGRPYEYTEGLFRFVGRTMAVGNITYRMLEGWLTVLLGLVGRKAPDHSTIHERLSASEWDLGEIGDVDVAAVDSSGISINTGEVWMKEKYGGKGKRGFVKVHIMSDVATNRVLGHLVTDDRAADVNHMLPVVDAALANGNRPAKVLADAAYDALYNWDGMDERGIDFVANHRQRDSPKCGLNPRGNSKFDLLRLGEEAWKDKYGYRMRWKVESTFSDIKRMTGFSVRSRSRGYMCKEMDRRLAVFNMLKDYRL